MAAARGWSFRCWGGAGVKRSVCAAGLLAAVLGCEAPGEFAGVRGDGVGQVSGRTKNVEALQHEHPELWHLVEGKRSVFAKALSQLTGLPDVSKVAPIARGQRSLVAPSETGGFFSPWRRLKGPEGFWIMGDGSHILMIDLLTQSHEAAQRALEKGILDRGPAEVLPGVTAIQAIACPPGNRSLSVLRWKWSEFSPVTDWKQHIENAPIIGFLDREVYPFSAHVPQRALVWGELHGLPRATSGAPSSRRELICIVGVEDEVVKVVAKAVAIVARARREALSREAP